MKTLILTLIFSTTVLADAIGPEMNRLSDSEISNKLISVARDIQNEKILADIPALQSCGQTFQRSAAGNPSDPAAIRVLEGCIRQQIGSEAANISDKLNLETYQLIPSKNVQNVTKYLTNKMYKNLTGVDRTERDNQKLIQSMKFNNKKQIDHKVFYELYKSQIAKNVLYEVSRFCFNDLRQVRPTSSNHTFTEHWDNLSRFNAPVNPGDQGAPAVTDSGSPAFDQSNPNPGAQDPTAAYTAIMGNIFASSTGTPPTNDQLKNFFMFCGKQIQELCKNYETNVTANPNAPGKKACLAKTRLTAFRQAMKNTDKITEEFMKKEGKDMFLALDGNAIVKRYQNGAGDEKSLNEITNTASSDFFKETQNDSSQGAQDCIDANGRGAVCDNFSIVDNSAARIEQNTNLVYIAKKEAELNRVRELVRKGDQSFETYIEENYPDLKGKINASNVDKLIGDRWESRRLAMIAEIQQRIKPRQVSDQTPPAPAQATGSTPQPTPVEAAALINAQDALNERTRLAQVVFFNNIITSSIELEDTSGKKLGRNVQALENELDTTESQIQPGFFTNLRTLTKDPNGGSGNQLQGNENVTSIDFLDDFIGIPKDESRNPASPSN